MALGKVRSDVQEWHWKETLYWEYDIQLLALDSNKDQHVQLLALNGWKKSIRSIIGFERLEKDNNAQLLALDEGNILTSNYWL